MSAPQGPQDRTSLLLMLALIASGVGVMIRSFREAPPKAP